MADDKPPELSLDILYEHICRPLLTQHLSDNVPISGIIRGLRSMDPRLKHTQLDIFTSNPSDVGLAHQIYATALATLAQTCRDNKAKQLQIYDNDKIRSEFTFSLFRDLLQITVYYKYSYENEERLTEIFTMITEDLNSLYPDNQAYFSYGRDENGPFFNLYMVPYRQMLREALLLLLKHNLIAKPHLLLAHWVYRVPNQTNTQNKIRSRVQSLYDALLDCIIRNRGQCTNLMNVVTLWTAQSSAIRDTTSTPRQAQAASVPLSTRPGIQCQGLTLSERQLGIVQSLYNRMKHVIGKLDLGMDVLIGQHINLVLEYWCMVTGEHYDNSFGKYHSLFRKWCDRACIQPNVDIHRILGDHKLIHIRLGDGTCCSIINFKGTNDDVKQLNTLSHNEMDIIHKWNISGGIKHGTTYRSLVKSYNGNISHIVLPGLPTPMREDEDVHRGGSKTNYQASGEVVTINGRVRRVYLGPRGGRHIKTEYGYKRL